MAEPNWFTGAVEGEDPRIAQARAGAGASPFLVALTTALQTQARYKNRKQGAVLGASLGFLQGLLATDDRNTAATLARNDIATQEEFTRSLSDRFAGEQDWMQRNGTPLDNERLQLRMQSFASLTKLLNSSDPSVRAQAYQQIGQLSQQDNEHFSTIDRNTETQRQERYALRLKQGDQYRAEFNSLQDEQRLKEEDYNEVAAILSDPTTDIQAKRAAYFKYAQTSRGDAIGADGTHFSAAPFGLGVSFDMLKEMTPAQMLAAANDAHTARIGVIPPRLDALMQSAQRDGFAFNSDNGGVDDLNLLRDEFVKRQYQATSQEAPTGAPSTADKVAEFVSDPLGGLMAPGNEISASLNELKKWLHDITNRTRPTNE